MNNAAINTAQMTTTQLFDLANGALIAKSFSEARRYLDDLSRRDDNRHALCDASVYGVPESYRQVIQDRIELVNAKAGVEA